MSYINETSAPDLTGTESKWCRKMLTDEAARSTISVPEEFASDCKRRRIDRQPRTTPGTYTHKNDCTHCRDFIIISCIGSRTLTWTFFLGWETCTIDRVVDVWLRRFAHCFFGDQRNLREYFLHENSVRAQLSVIILQYGTNRMTLNFERPPCDSSLKLMKLESGSILEVRPAEWLRQMSTYEVRGTALTIRKM